MSGSQHPEPRQAVERHSRWPGWIWSVPIAAVAIVAYLAFQQFTQQGPSVTVTFPTAGGIQSGQTKVQYEGIDVGQVEKVSFQKDLKHVEAVLRLDRDMSGHLGPGTRFWIAGHPSITDLASIKSVITGPHIGIEPHPGDTQDHYDGLARRPVTANDTKGTHYVLQADRLGTVSRGSPINYRDMQVGEVEGTQLAPDRSQFRIDIFVEAPYDAMIRTGTYFWDSGAVQLSMASGGPRMAFQSVPALFQGSISLDTPDGTAAGKAAQPDSRFRLYDTKDRAEHAPRQDSVRYRVVFHTTDAGGLRDGAPVMLQDKQIGSVLDTRLQYDPQQDRLDDVVTLVIDPWRIALAGDTKWADNPRPQLDAMLRQLIQQGLRARLGSTIPIVGGKTVQLAFVSGPEPAELGAGDPPELPTGPESGISGVLAAVNGVAAKLNAVPLDQIAHDVHQVTQRLAALSQSPELQKSLQDLEQSIANLQQVTSSARHEVGPTLEALHRTARDAQTTVADARKLISNNQYARSAPGTASVGETLYELSRAARSLRELADYLDRHPAALLHGRGG